MNNDIYISYLLTTFNKKDYLKVSLPFVLSQLLPNEELVIYDAQSNDGTQEFIREIIQNKQNVIFRSERDLGEAHGINKCILNARGKYLKNISDDDVYHFQTIRQACRWLDDHPEVDWVGSNGIAYFYEKNTFHNKNEEVFFHVWKKTGKPFLLTGLGYILRKDSVSKLGLFNTACKIVDYEYSLRNLSNPKMNFALSVLPFYVNIVNPHSNSVNMYNDLVREYSRYQKFYGRINFAKILSDKFKMNLIALKIKLKKLFNKSLLREQVHFKFSEVFENANQYIEVHNKQNSFKIIY